MEPFLDIGKLATDLAARIKESMQMEVTLDTPLNTLYPHALPPQLLNKLANDFNHVARRYIAVEFLNFYLAGGHHPKLTLTAGGYQNQSYATEKCYSADLGLDVKRAAELTLREILFYVNHAYQQICLQYAEDLKKGVIKLARATSSAASADPELTGLINSTRRNIVVLEAVLDFVEYELGKDTPRSTREDLGVVIGHIEQAGGVLVLRENRFIS
ncbi:TPA: hypothetical protein HA246_02750 [Candidatus Woesearchaeota archaeon]|nr:hypothetical protein [Candidatus Woesearchaeota archaeon]